MSQEERKKTQNSNFSILISLCIFTVIFGGLLFLNHFFPAQYEYVKANTEIEKVLKPFALSLDTKAYDTKMLELANYPVPQISSTTSATSSVATSTAVRLWPVKTVYPNAGALLPFNRIIAYYGNFYSKRMGVLGEYPEEEVLQKLKDEMNKWQTADPTTPVIPAINYIAMTAQESAGEDGKYRLRMPDSQIDQAISMAQKINGIVILDVQIGLSTLQTELPLLEKYLKMPQVHLGLDPEFAMHDGKIPGEYIGSLDAVDINYAANYLASLVKANNLPPKVMIVHRFTQNMVTNYKKITPLPEVQIVIDMDGWGSQPRKIGTYKQVIQPEPVQFTGFKLFYKNDFKEPGSSIMTPAEVLKLQPRPSFIQYQ
jgi:hypothetical protein